MNSESSRGAPRTATEPGRRRGSRAKTLAATPESGGEDTDFVLAADPPAFLGHEDRYRVDAEIARGGMGIVLEAQDIQLQRRVAIKLLHESHHGNPKLHEQFLAEARISGRLQHPGIVPIYEVGQAPDDRPFFVMKFVEGQTLAAHLSGRKDFHEDLPRLMKIFDQVCQTLSYVHAQGVVHLDIKPANVMVGAFGEVYLMDWGVARLWRNTVAGSWPQQTGRADRVAEATVAADGARAAPWVGGGRAPWIRGTPEYMSPEQARGEAVDVRSDVFGLGAMLCEILTGRPPYRGIDVQQVYRRAVQASLERALWRLDRCNAHRLLVRLAKRCLAPDPQDRPADAQIVTQELTVYLEDLLEQTQHDWGRFFELSPDLFCIASLDGYFRRVNANFSRILGYSTQELISRPFMDFVHPVDRERTVAVMQQLALGQPVIRFENRYRDVAGRYHLLEWTAKSELDEGAIFAVARLCGRAAVG